MPAPLRAVVVLGLLLVAAAPARAAAAAVLVVEDHGNELIERTGARLYLRFLEAGPYRRVVPIVGEAGRAQTRRLAAVIRRLAEEHEVVDLFLSIHTTERSAAELQALLPAEARRVRLVYSTACHGAEAERGAWESIGARAVVTHEGLNNPLVALPYFLSRWLEGATLERCVREGYRESDQVMRFILSLPGAPASTPDGLVLEETLAGSRPVVSGALDLTIGQGLADHVPRCPPELRYDRGRGGPLGLLLAALCGRFGVPGGDVTDLLGRLGLPSPLGPDELARVEGLFVEEGPDGPEVVLTLADPLEVRLDAASRLRLERRAVLRPGRLDPGQRTLELFAQGVSLVRGDVRLEVRRLAVVAAADGDGYALEAEAAVYGLAPAWGTIPLGGRLPGAPGELEPRLLPR